MVANGHALVGRKSAHQWDDFFDVRIAVAVDEWQPKDAHVDTLHPKKHFLSRKLAQRIRIDWIASIVFVGEAATIGSVCQPGAQENEALDICVACGRGEMSGSAFIDGMRLFRCRAPEERSAVHNRGDALDRGNKRVGIEEVALHEFYLVAQ